MQTLGKKSAIIPIDTSGCNVTFLLVECRLFYKQIKVEGKVENVNELDRKK